MSARACVLLAVLLLHTSPASASDGILEISQTCAVETGCFAGDTAGFPVTITAPGSYRLTSNLSRTLSIGGSLSASFIEVAADDVHLDLGGFRISCRNQLGAACTGTGSGVAGSSANSGDSVRNGSVVGMPVDGVSLGNQAEVTNLRVRSNRVDGISTGSGSSVYANTVYQNGDDGITAVVGSTISGNTVFQNGYSGIFVGEGSTVSDNTVYDNDRDGIEAGAGCTVKDNAVRANTRFGLKLGQQSGYGGNVISANTAGTVDGSSLVDLGDNACNGTATCP